MLHSGAAGEGNVPPSGKMTQAGFSPLQTIFGWIVPAKTGGLRELMEIFGVD
jgi:hypothetical protein